MFLKLIYSGESACESGGLSSDRGLGLSRSQRLGTGLFLVIEK